LGDFFSLFSSVNIINRTLPRIGVKINSYSSCNELGNFSKRMGEEIQSYFFDLELRGRNHCDKCKRPRAFVCKNCGVACYCSRECQAQSAELNEIVCIDIQKKRSNVLNCETRLNEMGPIIT
jgi:hypothetical protein